MSNNAWNGKGLDEHLANDLFLTMQSDPDLYRQQEQPIQKNLTAKKARGVYNHALAVKLYGYLVENGAKKYYAEQIEGKRVTGAFVQHVNPEWARMFPPKLRQAVAEEFADRFEGEHALGNYNSLLPKKYQSVAKKPTKTRTARKVSGTTLGGMR